MKKRNALVLASDQKYLEYTKQVFYSAHRYGNWKGDYILLACDMGNADLSWFKERNIHVLDLEPLTKIRVNDWPPIIFHKFYLLHPMMKRWNKLVYLDTDIIVLKDMNHLTQLDRFAACPDYYLSIREQFFDIDEVDSKRKSKIKHLERKYNLSKLSFNVGMMVINAQKNSLPLFEKALDILDGYHDVVKYPEQAIFNLCFYKKWKMLYKYNNYLFLYKNLSVPKNESKEEHNIVISHHIGLTKPWHQDNGMHQVWKNNYANADSFPAIEQIGEKAHSTDHPGFFDIFKKNLRVAYRVYQKKTRPAMIKKWHNFTWQIELFLKKHMPGAYVILKKKFGRKG